MIHSEYFSSQILIFLLEILFKIMISIHTINVRELWKEILLKCPTHSSYSPDLSGNSYFNVLKKHLKRYFKKYF